MPVRISSSKFTRFITVRLFKVNDKENSQGCERRETNNTSEVLIHLDSSQHKFTEQEDDTLTVPTTVPDKASL